MTDLPVNVDSTYADDGGDPSVQLHQEHHDVLHALHNALDGATPDVSTVAGLAATKGYVNHGATASTARPTGYASIEWYGSVEPTNAVDGDTWVDTSA